MTSLKGLFARVRFREHRRAHAERKRNREQEPAGVTDTGAGIRHGRFRLTDPSLNGVFTVRSSDGGDLERVTANPGGDDCPSDYSPSGNRIVFTRANETTYALYTVRPAGSGLRQISPPGLNFNFCNGSWSPQGNEILLSAHQPSLDYHSSMWLLHANGTGLRRIPAPDCAGLNADPEGVGCFNPGWSPVGRKIVFGRQVDSQPRDIYTVRNRDRDR
jgi:hypothetical protein